MSNMTEALARPVSAAAAAAAKPVRTPQPVKKQRRKLMLPVTLLLVAAAWGISRQKWYTPGSDTGYYMGVVGGVLMLALLLYPLRKHVGFMQSWGAGKHWFRAHMFLGITGPMLILLHSTFHVGSLNAGVALTCMLIVSGSGITGRFFYTKIHNGLYGRRASLQERQQQLGISAGDVKSKFHFAPAVEERLKRFEAQALVSIRNPLQETVHFVTLGLRARFVHWQTGRILSHLLKQAAKNKGWSSAKFSERLSYSKGMIRSYLDAVQDTAQFTTYEKLFSLWHVLHVPFVYMLVISAIFHVIAVHMY
jgi:hypothetical protein